MAYFNGHKVSELEELFANDLNEDDFIMVSHLEKKDSYGNRSDVKKSMKMKVSELIRYIKNRHFYGN